jgi:hypothetical protein
LKYKVNKNTLQYKVFSCIFLHVIPAQRTAIGEKSDFFNPNPGKADRFIAHSDPRNPGYYQAFIALHQQG